MFAPIARFVRVLRDQRLRVHFKSLTLVYQDSVITIDAQSESAVTQAYGTFPTHVIGLVEQLLSGAVSIEYKGYSVHGEVTKYVRPEKLETIDEAIEFIRASVGPDPRKDPITYLKMLYEAYDPTGYMSDDHRYFASSHRISNEITRLTGEAAARAGDQVVRQIREAHINDLIQALLAHKVCIPGEAAAMVSDSREKCEALILASIAFGSTSNNV
jgi:hypothetical protein